MIVGFLESHTCYDLLEDSTKVIVIDARLSLRLGFFALVEHGVQAAPLWSSEKHNFCGVLSSRDFVRALLVQKEKLEEASAQGRGVEEADDVSEQSILDFKEIDVDAQMPCADAEETLLDACRTMYKHRLDKLPVVDRVQNIVLMVLTHVAVMKYLVSKFCEEPALFNMSARSLGIGTYENLITVSQTEELYKVLGLMNQYKITGIPVVSDSNGTVCDLYCQSSITEIGKTAVLNMLSAPVGQVIQAQVSAAATAQPGGQGIAPTREVLETVHENATLLELFQKFGKSNGNRLVYTDTQGQIKGVVSLFDLFAYLLRNDNADDEGNGDNEGDVSMS